MELDEAGPRGSRDSSAASSSDVAAAVQPTLSGEVTATSSASSSLQRTGVFAGSIASREEEDGANEEEDEFAGEVRHIFNRSTSAAASFNGNLTPTNNARQQAQQHQQHHQQHYAQQSPHHGVYGVVPPLSAQVSPSNRSHSLLPPTPNSNHHFNFAPPLDPNSNPNTNHLTIAQIQAKLDDLQRQQQFVQQQQAHQQAIMQQQHLRIMQEQAILQQQQQQHHQYYQPYPDPRIPQQGAYPPVAGHSSKPPRPLSINVSYTSSGQAEPTSASASASASATTPSRKRDRGGSFSQPPAVERPGSAAAALPNELDNRTPHEHRQHEFRRVMHQRSSSTRMELLVPTDEDERLQALKRCKSVSPMAALQNINTRAYFPSTMQIGSSIPTAVTSASAVGAEDPSPHPSRSPAHRRCKTEDLQPHEIWHCMYMQAGAAQACGKMYRMSSGRSISKHMQQCRHRPADATLQLSPNGSPGERHKKRRKSELSTHERWHCPFQCGQQFRNTSSKAIRRHHAECDKRPPGDTSEPILPAKQAAAASPPAAADATDMKDDAMQEVRSPIAFPTPHQGSGFSDESDGSEEESESESEEEEEEDEGLSPMVPAAKNEFNANGINNALRRRSFSEAYHQTTPSPEGPDGLGFQADSQAQSQTSLPSLPSLPNASPSHLHLSSGGTINTTLPPFDRVGSHDGISPPRDSVQQHERNIFAMQQQQQRQQQQLHAQQQQLLHLQQQHAQQQQRAEQHAQAQQAAHLQLGDSSIQSVSQMQKMQHMLQMAMAAKMAQLEPQPVNTTVPPPPPAQGLSPTSALSYRSPDLAANSLQLQHLQLKLAELQRMKEAQQAAHAIDMANVQQQLLLPHHHLTPLQQQSRAMQLEIEASQQLLMQQQSQLHQQQQQHLLLHDQRHPGSAALADPSVNPSSPTGSEDTAGLLRLLLQRQQHENQLLLHQSQMLHAQQQVLQTGRYDHSPLPQDIERPSSSASMRDLSSDMSNLNWHHASAQHHPHAPPPQHGYAPPHGYPHGHSGPPQYSDLASSAHHRPPSALHPSALTAATARSAVGGSVVVNQSNLALAKKAMKSRRVGAQLPPNERWTCPLKCGKFYKKSSSNSIRRHAMECLTLLHAKSSPVTPVTQDELLAMMASGVDRTLRKRQPAAAKAASAAAAAAAIAAASPIGGSPTQLASSGLSVPPSFGVGGTGMMPDDLLSGPLDEDEFDEGGDSDGLGETDLAAMLDQRH